MDPEPILIDEAGSNQRVLLVSGGGKIVEQYVATYTDIDAAVAAILDEAQSAWDMGHVRED